MSLENAPDDVKLAVDLIVLLEENDVYDEMKPFKCPLRLRANAKLPDALRLSDLHRSCNILNSCGFVGRIRRSRRIRHEQRALCQ